MTLRVYRELEETLDKMYSRYKNLEPMKTKRNYLRLAKESITCTKSFVNILQETRMGHDCT